MGGKNSSEGAAAAQKTDERINAGDLKAGMNLIATGGRSSKGVSQEDFERAFEAQAKMFGLMSENDTIKELQQSKVGVAATQTAITSMDMDGDGKLTAKDIELLFKQNSKFIEKNTDAINETLPVAGQAAFGVAVGYGFGSVIYSFAKRKILLSVVGYTTYSAMQFYAQQDFIDKYLFETAVNEKLMEIGDLNGDGVVDRQDLEIFMEKRMSLVDKKLGPGGFLPGAAGYGTFTLGLLKGARFI